MKTKVTIIGIFLALVAGTTPAANAVEQKTLVIIDSGFNTQLPFLAGNVVDEACFIEYGKCPNGQASMTGLGAATLAATDAAKDKTFNHGTQMASVANAVNPSTKFVLIRVIGKSDKGYANTYTTKAVQLALDWVSANAERLNVGAVSVSFGRVYREAACPIEAKLQAQIAGLASVNVPVVISTGNNSDQKKINYPACIPQAIAVGATDTPYTIKQVTGTVYPIMLISNSSPELDLYAMGRWTATDINGVKAVSLGTSGATVSVATRLAKEVSGGSTIGTVMDNVKASLQNAYRTVTVFERKYW
jgi:hypothetical protein